MTVEAALTRALGITFIDAREVAIQARLNLEIYKYPTEIQKALLVTEAIHVFENELTEDARQAMKSRSRCRLEVDDVTSLRSFGSAYSQTSEERATPSSCGNLLIRSSPKPAKNKQHPEQQELSHRTVASKHSRRLRLMRMR